MKTKKDEWSEIVYENLTSEENETIRKARRAGYAEFFPCFPLWTDQGTNTLKGALSFLAKAKFNVNNTPKSLKSLNAFIQLTYQGVELVQGKGYVYLSALDFDSELALDIAGLFTISIPVCKWSHCDYAFWLREVKIFMDEIAEAKQLVKLLN